MLIDANSQIKRNFSVDFQKKCREFLYVISEIIPSDKQSTAQQTQTMSKRIQQLTTQTETQSPNTLAASV